MSDTIEYTGDQEWVIWNGAHGLVSTVTIGHFKIDTDRRTAWLDEPFDMVGPLNLDELEASGRIAFAACLVMSRQKWQEDQVELRRESLKLRRAGQERMSAEFARASTNGRGYVDNRTLTKERQHRETLNLPIDGNLSHARSRLPIDASRRRYILMLGAQTNYSFVLPKLAMRCYSTLSGQRRLPLGRLERIAWF